MEDDLEETVLKQACASQMKVLSKFTFNAVGFFNRGSGSSLTYFLKLLLRPEVFLLAIVIFVFCFYLQALELNANGFINRISNKLRFKSKSKISFAVSSIAEKDSWEEVKTQSAVYAVQGRRPKMEDRSVAGLISHFPHTFGSCPRNFCFPCGRILIDSENSRARADFLLSLRRGRSIALLIVHKEENLPPKKHRESHASDTLSISARAKNRFDDGREREGEILRGDCITGLRLVHFHLCTERK